MWFQFYHLYPSLFWSESRQQQQSPQKSVEHLQDFVEQAPFDMELSLEESTAITPFFFVLFPGPTKGVLPGVWAWLEPEGSLRLPGKATSEVKLMTFLHPHTYHHFPAKQQILTSRFQFLSNPYQDVTFHPVDGRIPAQQLLHTYV